MTDIESKEHDELLLEVARQRLVIADLINELAIARGTAEAYQHRAEHMTACGQEAMKELRGLRTLAAPAKLIAKRWADMGAHVAGHLDGLLDQLTEAVEQLGG